MTAATNPRRYESVPRSSVGAEGEQQVMERQLVENQAKATFEQHAGCGHAESSERKIEKFERFFKFLPMKEFSQFARVMLWDGDDEKKFTSRQRRS
ncbi:MAG: hypothetical protein R3F54_07665 [Alphaproteobacteria bacterium]